MRLLLTVFVFSFFGAVFIGCDSGGDGGGGFVPTGDILAVAERAGQNQTIKVGGIEGSVPPGSTVEVTNLTTLETQTTFGLPDGSFDPTFIGNTNNRFNVLVTNNSNIVEDIDIGVTLLRNAVERNLAQLGSVPDHIQIRGNRLYVINGFSDNIQIFDINQNSPQQIGTIVVPPGSDPVDMAFIDDTRAYVANTVAQTVAIVNVETRECETIFVEDGSDTPTIPCQTVVTVPADSFEDPSSIAIANDKVYISNNNLAGFSDPFGNGFVTVIDSDLNEVIDIIDATGANSTTLELFDGDIILVNAGNLLATPDFSEFFCDEEFPPSIDIIDPQTDSIVDTIEIPLSQVNTLVCLPNALAINSSGFGYLGLGVVGSLLKVDLLTNTVINGTDNPIAIADTPGLNFTADIAIRDDLLFTTLFNTDQIAVLDTNTDQVNPFPYISPFPAGIRADNPNSEFFDGVQLLAIRPGVSGVDFTGADIYFITGLSEQLGSVDSTLQTQ